jgi:hypothetical protein
MFCGTSVSNASATFTMPSWRISSAVIEVIGFADVTLGFWMRVPVTCTSTSSSSSSLSSSAAAAACALADQPVSAKHAAIATKDARANDTQVNLDTVNPLTPCMLCTAPS